LRGRAVGAVLRDRGSVRDASCSINGTPLVVDVTGAIQAGGLADLILESTSLAKLRFVTLAKAFVTFRTRIGILRASRGVRGEPARRSQDAFPHSVNGSIRVLRALRAPVVNLFLDENLRVLETTADGVAGGSSRGEHTMG